MDEGVDGGGHGGEAEQQRHAQHQRHHVRPRVAVGAAAVDVRFCRYRLLPI